MKQYQEMLAAKYAAEDQRLEVASAGRKVSSGEFDMGNSKPKVASVNTGVVPTSYGNAAVQKISGKAAGSAVAAGPSDRFVYGNCSCFGLLPGMGYRSY